jgi:hypothetical protein
VISEQDDISMHSASSFTLQVEAKPQRQSNKNGDEQFYNQHDGDQIHHSISDDEQFEDIEKFHIPPPKQNQIPNVQYEEQAIESQSSHQMSQNGQTNSQ